MGCAKNDVGGLFAVCSWYCGICGCRTPKPRFSHYDADLCHSWFWLSFICLHIFGVDHLSYSTEQTGNSCRLVLVCVYRWFKCIWRLLFQLGNISAGTSQYIMDFIVLGGIGGSICSTA